MDACPLAIISAATAMSDPSPLRFVSADEYCRRARIDLSGRTLQNWCDAITRPGD